MNSAANVQRQPSSHTSKDQRLASDFNTKFGSLPIWIATILFAAILLPPELSFFIGTFNISPYRVVFAISLPWLIFQFFHGKVKLGPFDILMIIAVLWLPLAVYQHYGVARALESGGVVSMDIIVGYFLGRACLKSLNDLTFFLKLILPVFLLAGLFVMIESLGGDYYFRSLAGSLSGQTEQLSGFKRELRLGLLRGMGFFPHPILAGAFLCSFMPLYMILTKDRRYRTVGIAAATLGFFTLSSAAIMGLVLNLALLLYHRVQRFVRELNWPKAVLASVIVALILQFFSQGGLVSAIYRYLTFNPQTGWYRTQIWKYAGGDALNNPLFGIGFEAYTRPVWFGSGNSVDAHFLYFALTFGMIPAVIFLTVYLGSILKLARLASVIKNQYFHTAYVYMAISFSIQVFILFTVTYWGGLNVWLNFFAGAMVSLGSMRVRRIRRTNDTREVLKHF